MTYNSIVPIGPTPAEEPCAQVGEADYEVNAKKECRRFIDLIRKAVGSEPEGAKLDISANRHDFGTYYDVVVKFNDQVPQAVEYAYRVESEAPLQWEESK